MMCRHEMLVVGRGLSRVQVVFRLRPQVFQKAQISVDRRRLRLDKLGLSRKWRRDKKRGPIYISRVHAQRGGGVEGGRVRGVAADRY